MATTIDLLTLTMAPGVDSRLLQAIAGRGPGDVVARPSDHADLLPARALKALGGGAARRDAETEMSRASQLGIKLVGWDEPDYPPLLRRLYDPPAVLYVKGSLRAGEGDRAVTVVGSRAASPQGCEWARRAARELAGEGASVVSGLARGIDSAAHLGSLEAEGRTVAVLGTGVDRVYPPENQGLASAIAERGALVSEFRLGTGPWRSNFPRRNRVLAGWGRGVVIVEAAQRSGALVTARLALEEGREVMAVPGHPGYPGAAGTNSLIRDGAALVRDASDVADELGWPRPKAADSSADAIVEAMAPGLPIGLEELAGRLDCPPGELLSRLSRLELERQVRRLPGALYVRN